LKNGKADEEHESPWFMKNLKRCPATMQCGGTNCHATSWGLEIIWNLAEWFKVIV